MGPNLVGLAPEHADALEARLPEIWRGAVGNAWTSRFTHEVVQWRYWHRPTGETHIALLDGRCVGMIDAFVRPYSVAGERRMVRECCDWWCDPALRPSGLGLRLMRRLMQGQTPIIAVGGSPISLTLLAKLGWRRLGDVEVWVLPLKARYVAAALLRRRGREHLARLVPPFLPLARVRQMPSPSADAAVREWRSGDPTPGPPSDASDVVALADEADVGWLSGAPACLTEARARGYTVDGQLSAFALTQLEPVLSGREGKLLHLQVVRESSALLDWVVGDCVAYLARLGAGIIRARAGTVAMRVALQRAGFVVQRKEPVFWWGSNGPSPDAPLRLSYLRADDALNYEAAVG